MRYRKITHALLLSIFGASVTVPEQLQDSHILLIAFLTLISDHSQHMQRQNILNIQLITNDT